MFHAARRAHTALKIEVHATRMDAVEQLATAPAAVKSLRARALTQLRDLLRSNEQAIRHRAADAGQEADVLTDDEFSDLIQQFSQGLNPEVGDMVAQGERLGRRLRRRNRAAAAAGSALAVVVVAGKHWPPRYITHIRTIARGSRLVSGRPAPGRPGGAGPRPAAGPAPRQAAGHAPGKAAGPGMIGCQLMTTLRRLLPPGSVLTHVNPYSTTRGSLEVDYNDGRGAVDLTISVTRTWTNLAELPASLWANEATRPAGA